MHEDESSRAELVLRRYADAFEASEDEAKQHRWGSSTAWFARFALVERSIDWSTVRRWVDVGCGTAKLFEVSLPSRSGIFAVGVDPSAPHVERARGKDWSRAGPPPNFVRGTADSLLAHAAGGFDLVTSVGVIYEATSRPGPFLAQLLRLAREGGQVLVTSENPSFRGFRAAAGDECWEASRFRAAIRELRPGAQVTIMWADPLSKALVETVEADTERAATYKELFIRAVV